MNAAEAGQRLAEHLRRFGHAVFEPEARVTPPIATTAVGCPGGPSWGVVPRAESTVNSAVPPKKQLQDLVNWLLRNDFEQDVDVSSKVPPDIDRTLVHPDGTRLHLAVPNGQPPLTLTVTGPCSWPSDRPGGPPPGGLKPLRGESGPMTAGGNEVCSSPRNYVYNRDAPPFTGTGPHPITLVDLDRAIGSTGTSGPKQAGYPLLPGWEPRRAGSSDVDTTKVQLIACVHAEEAPGGSKKVTCRFDEGPLTFDLVESTYRVTVREARTGNQLADLTLRGTQGDKQSCPTAVTYYKDITPRLLRGIDIAGFRDPLRPLVEGSR
ncbi:hypothetical protein HUW46_04132 [Amycolatopsis sp. CA-230715]|nr:hypothetical protein HUW46_04132 [Amycolatopsis sp. CA-230715]